MADTLGVEAIAFAEDFVPAPDNAAQARLQAVKFNADLPSDATLAALTFAAKVLDAGAVVEIGTGTGASGLALFAGMAENGVLTSIDPESDRQANAREVFTRSGIPARRFRLISGRTLDILGKLSSGSYDLVYVNGDKLELVEYLDQAFRLLRVGGVIVLDHALWGGLVADENNEDDETLIIREALQAVRDTEQLASLMMPLGDGLLMAVKTGEPAL